MLANYGYIGLFLIVAIIFTITALILLIIFRFLKIIPQKPSPTKSSTFECGMETIGKTRVQFNFRYYFYTLIFLVLDVLIVFLYPWAAGLRQLGYPSLIVLLPFQ